MMSDIYISYKSDEQGHVKARQLRATLEREGWSVWWDHNFAVSENLDLLLEEVRCVIVLWSKNSVVSPYVKAEASHALSNEKLLPVLIDEVELPLIFGDVHPLDLVGWKGESEDPRLQELFDGVNQIISRSEVAEAESLGQSQRKRSTSKTYQNLSVDSSEDQIDSMADRQDSSTPPSASGKLPELKIKWFSTLSSISWRHFLSSSLLAMVLLAVITGSLMSTRLGIARMGTIQSGSIAVTPCQSVPGQGPQMVIIPSGRFTRVSVTDDTQVEGLTLNRSFAIGRCEVTFAEYKVFATATNRDLPDDEGWGSEQRPVINVSWEDAVAYAEWLSQQTGRRYRLPTEAEWEYAARAGSVTKYSWGDMIDQDGKVWANCDGCGSQWDNNQTAPVGSFDANAFGLHDMAGNVWEWTKDCSLKSDKEECGARRVIRGGSWYSIPGELRSAYRIWDYPDERFSHLGFRLAQDL